MLVRVQEWLESFSRWPEQRKLVSSSLMKLMLWVEQGEINNILLLYFKLNSIISRFDDGAGGDNEVQRTMLELINQLDGFDPRGNIKVLMFSNLANGS